jgi:hypothetical protein
MTAPLLSSYAPLPGTFDELIGPDGPRPPFARVTDALDRLSKEELARYQQLAETALLHQGVTFSVYADARGTEKIFPFCLVPRLVAATDFAHVERGLEQRLRALAPSSTTSMATSGSSRPASSRPRPCSARVATSRSCAASDRPAGSASTSPASI